MYLRKETDMNLVAAKTLVEPGDIDTDHAVVPVGLAPSVHPPSRIRHAAAGELVAKYFTPSR
jgi:hypothetical protein